MKIAEILQNSRKPLLNFQEILLLSGSKPESLKVVLSRLAGSGKISRVERGKYTALSDPIAICSYIIQPSYISTLAGLFIHKRTTQIPRKIDVFSSKRHKSVVFENSTIEFFTVLKNRMNGYGKVPYGKYQIFVGCPEKCIADMLYLNYPEYLMEEAMGAGSIDNEKILSYCKGLGKKKYDKVVELIK